MLIHYLVNPVLAQYSRFHYIWIRTQLSPGSEGMAKSDNEEASELGSEETADSESDAEMS